MSLDTESPPYTTSKIHPWYSLRTRLGVATGAIVISVAVIISITVSISIRRQLEAATGQALAQRAFQVADTLDRGMFERYRDVQLLATLDVIRDPDTPPDQQRELLEKLQSTFPNYAWIGIADQNGVVQASTGGLLEGENVATRPWFIGSQRDPFVGDVHETVLLANLLPNQDGHPLRFVDVAAPIYDQQGQFRGVLGAHLSWQWARDVQRQVLEPAQVQAGTEIFVLSRSGDVLLSPPTFQQQQLALPQVAEAAPQRATYAVMTESADTSYLVGIKQSQGYLTYPGLGWQVVVRQPAQTAFASARELQGYILLFGVGLGALFAVLAWYVTGRFVNPLLAIAAASDRILQGDTATTLPTLRGRDELAQLSTSITTLVNSLVSRDAALRSSNAQLRDELQERGRAEAERERLYQAAQAALHARDEFLAVAAHELKTPVTNVRGFAQVLLRRAGRSTDGKIEVAGLTSALDVIDQQSDKLTQLVDQLLNLSRLEAGQLSLHPQPFDLTMLTRDVVTTCQLNTDRHSITLTAPEPFPIIADPLRIEQVISNLVSNAIKFSPTGGPVAIEIAPNDAQTVSITVHDRGIGIPVEHRGHIFDRFYQAHAKTYHSGMGLGLYISRQIVELHGGALTVEFPPDGGTRFRITLPCCPDETLPNHEGTTHERPITHSVC